MNHLQKIEDSMKIVVDDSTKKIENFDLKNVKDCGFDLKKFLVEREEGFEDGELEKMYAKWLKILLPRFC